MDLEKKKSRKDRHNSADENGGEVEERDEADVEGERREPQRIRGEETEEEEERRGECGK